MRYLLTLSLLLMSFSAFSGVDCNKLKERIDRRAGKGKQNSRRSQKLAAKYDHFCVKQLDKSSWKSTRQSFRDNWKANKDSNKSLNRCTRLQFKYDKAVKNGKSRRAQRLLEKLEKKGCNQQ